MDFFAAISCTYYPQIYAPLAITNAACPSNQKGILHQTETGML